MSEDPQMKTKLFSSTEAARFSLVADGSIVAVLPSDRAIWVLLCNGQSYQRAHF
jgi:hypothetical protein